mmetsp:Transcript_8929/g.14080  ORF Transcript_8929/g.14080 Transcript_8929/m.14080 type:complete len:92 (+) Transcript_8929:1383-1658(+)
MVVPCDRQSCLVAVMPNLIKHASRPAVSHSPSTTTNRLLNTNTYSGYNRYSPHHRRYTRDDFYTTSGAKETVISRSGKVSFGKLLSPDSLT